MAASPSLTVDPVFAALGVAEAPAEVAPFQMMPHDAAAAAAAAAANHAAYQQQMYYQYQIHWNTQLQWSLDQYTNAMATAAAAAAAVANAAAAAEASYNCNPQVNTETLVLPGVLPAPTMPLQQPFAGVPVPQQSPLQERIIPDAQSSLATIPSSPASNKTILPASPICSLSSTNCSELSPPTSDVSSSTHTMTTCEDDRLPSLPKFDSRAAPQMGADIEAAVTFFQGLIAKTPESEKRPIPISLMEGCRLQSSAPIAVEPLAIKLSDALGNTLVADTPAAALAQCVMSANIAQVPTVKVSPDAGAQLLQMLKGNVADGVAQGAEILQQLKRGNDTPSTIASDGDDSENGRGKLLRRVSGGRAQQTTTKMERAKNTNHVWRARNGTGTFSVA